MLTTTETKTVATLYRTNHDIRDLIDAWVQERRCPMGLVDELLIEGMDSAADCALWAATESVKNVFEPNQYEPEQSAPYPAVCDDGKTCFWTVSDGWELKFSHRILSGSIAPDLVGGRRQESSRLAIIWILDSWVKA